MKLSRFAAHRRAGAASLALAMFAGCGTELARTSPSPRLHTDVSSSSAPSRITEPPEAPDQQTISVAPGDFDFSSSPGAMAMVTANPHSFFRFIAPQFTASVCHRFRDVIAKEPTVGIHGNAHLEQYGVTDAGLGLLHLDDAADGPPIVDLARMGTSIVLAIHERKATAGFAGNEQDVLRELLRGYAKGVDDPEARPGASAVDERLKRKASTNHAFLEAADGMMLHFETQEDEATARDLYRRWRDAYVDAFIVRPKIKTASFTVYDLKKIGRLRPGIDDAVGHGYLARIEGKTAAPDDDRIVELSRERVPLPGGCTEPRHDRRSERFSVFDFSRQPLMPLGIPGMPFWGREWPAHENALRLDSTLASIDDLRSVAFAVGVLLGKEHFRTLHARISTSPDTAATTEEAKRRLVLSAEDEAKLIEETRVLSEETETAWARFRDGLHSP